MSVVSTKVILGMQNYVLIPGEPWGLSLNETLLPQHLADIGYRSHAVGKWHLGFYKKSYVPMSRGFESHFGFWSGGEDYFDHIYDGSVSKLKFLICRGSYPAWID